MLNINEFRKDAKTKEWELPSWGYPLAIGVNPLFLELEGRISPIGTAFNVGGGIGMTITAYHCIEEALKRQPTRNNRQIFNHEINGGTLERCSFYILRSYRTGAKKLKFDFVPLEKISCGPPADVAFCAAQFAEGAITMENKISFLLPAPDQPLHSIGYCDFRFPENGIALSEVGRFDWENEYGHKLKVVEGHVDHIFTQKYANGYVRGPCFTFTGAISSGMSGGPIFDLKRGAIFGMNSATAFDQGLSIGSLFFPYVLHKVTFGANIFGDPNFRINSSQHIIQMLEFGSIKSDGSHSELIYHETELGLVAAMPFPKAYEGRIFDDFSGSQTRRQASTQDGSFFVRRSTSRKESF